MPAKYCTSSKCGKKTDYIAKPPKFCPDCGWEYAKAFVSQPIVTNVQPINRVIAKSRPPSRDPDDDSGPIDLDAIALSAQELAASVRADITVTTTAPFGVKLGDLLKNPDRFNVGNRTASQEVSDQE